MTRYTGRRDVLTTGLGAVAGLGLPAVAAWPGSSRGRAARKQSTAYMTMTDVYITGGLPQVPGIACGVLAIAPDGTITSYILGSSAGFVVPVAGLPSGAEIQAAPPSQLPAALGDPPLPGTFPYALTP